MEISGRVISIESRICQLTCALQLEFGSFQDPLCPARKFIGCLSWHQSLSALPKPSDWRLLISQKRFPVLGSLRNHDATPRTMPIKKKLFYILSMYESRDTLSHRLLFLSDKTITKLNLGKRETVDRTIQKLSIVIHVRQQRNVPRIITHVCSNCSAH